MLVQLCNVIEIPGDFADFQFSVDVVIVCWEVGLVLVVEVLPGGGRNKT